MRGPTDHPRRRLLLLMLVLAAAMAGPSPSSARDHLVGDSIWTWSIPPTPSFYTHWSNTTSIILGDALALFKFETGLYDVVQVSRRALEDCDDGGNPFRKFSIGPATVPLHRPDVYYFICTVGNYCRLGMKLAVKVQPQH